MYVVGTVITISYDRADRAEAKAYKGNKPVSGTAWLFTASSFYFILVRPLPTKPAGRGVPGQSTSGVRSIRVRRTPSILLYGHTIMCFWVSEYNSESVPSAALDAIFFCMVRSASFCYFNANIRVSPVRSWEHLNNRWN